MTQPASPPITVSRFCPLSSVRFFLMWEGTFGAATWFVV